jgi:hypothetical protein
LFPSKLASYLPVFVPPCREAFETAPEPQIASAELLNLRCLLHQKIFAAFSVKSLPKDNWLRLFAMVASFRAHPASFLIHPSEFPGKFARKSPPAFQSVNDNGYGFRGQYRSIRRGLSEEAKQA